MDLYVYIYISCLSFLFYSAYMKVRLIWQSSSSRTYIWDFFTVVQMQANLHVMRRQSKGHHLKLTSRHFARACLPTDCPDWTWKDKVHIFENLDICWMLGFCEMMSCSVNFEFSKFFYRCVHSKKIGICKLLSWTELLFNGYWIDCWNKILILIFVNDCDNMSTVILSYTVSLHSTLEQQTTMKCHPIINTLAELFCCYTATLTTSANFIVCIF